MTLNILTSTGETFRDFATVIVPFPPDKKGLYLNETGRDCPGTGVVLVSSLFVGTLDSDPSSAGSLESLFDPPIVLPLRHFSN